MGTHYLEKYVGTYRVIADYDLATLDFPRDKSGNIDESFDDLYISCSKGRIYYNETPGYLTWYCPKLSTGKSVLRKCEKALTDYKFIETDSEVMIDFKESELSIFVKFVTPQTKGKWISPFSKKNLPCELANYKIPAADEQMLYDITKDSTMSRVEKMQFFRRVVSSFDSIIISKKGKRFNLKKDRDATELKPKLYIHYIGMWEEFIKYVKSEYEKYGN